MHTNVGSVQDGFGPETVYVGRAGGASRGFGIQGACPFGKPWEFEKKPNWPELYIGYLIRRLSTEPAFAAEVTALHGKTLLCWCTKKMRDRGTEVRCHARLLAEFVELLNGHE